jgi:hypothetical protein
VRLLLLLRHTARLCLGQGALFARETPARRLALSERMRMSKGQKSNKENMKPKADKNRIKNVSAYKVAQSHAKPVNNRLGKKT